ncbi:MAG TPA: ABC transporter substrate-binding protein [Burkholderiales bacterium]|nr:ABC transporter substrate-binding protein [Burkholderiales bacterium]
MLAKLRRAQVGLWAMRIAVAIVYAATSLRPHAAEVAAKPVPTVNVITFGGGYALPLWAAERQGFFRKHGIEVKVTYTPNSVYMMKNLIEGRYDVAVSALDNMVAYQEGQGETQVAVQPDLVAYMGFDQSFQSLMASPDNRTVADLRGKELAVDALTTGFAFILREMVARAGMTDADVKYVRTGGGPARMRELVARKYAAGLLATPLDLIAEEKGLKRLGTARELLGRYQGRAAYSQRSWVRNNEATVIAFMRGYRDAMEWLYDRGNREIAAALLVANDASMTPALARRALDVLLDEKDGFFRDVALDLEGVKTVLALRTKFLPPAKPIEDPMKYVDLDLYRKAFPAR